MGDMAEDCRRKEEELAFKAEQQYSKYEKEVKMTEQRIKGIVNAVSPVKEHDGKLQIGWTLKENTQKWYNASGEEKELKILLSNIVTSGNEIEFNFDSLGNKVSGLVRIQKAKTENKSTSGNSNWQDDIVNFETLLTAAHNLKKPFSIETEMITVDLKEKYALFKAKVKIYATAEEYQKYCIGEVSEESKHHKRMLLQEFEAHGDATNDNITGTLIKPHFIRMAETRAICRALRWYTNNGCAEEEKGK